MPKTNYAIDVTFEVVGNYHKFSDIPYSILIEHMEKRLADLKTNPEPEAFGCFDICDIQE